jgi:hypothetical protein
MESEYINRKTKLIEYTKLHLISLTQDLEDLNTQMEELDPASKDYAELDFEYNYTAGQRTATSHLLSVMEEML